MAGAAFGEVHVSLFVAGAAFGEVPVSLFVVKFMCDFSWQVQHLVKCMSSLCVAGAAFGEVHV